MKYPLWNLIVELNHPEPDVLWRDIPQAIRQCCLDIRLNKQIDAATDP